MYQPLLRQLEAPVLIVEEAAEILESNLLAILTPCVKHLVLIGDLKQSRPKVCVIIIHVGAKFCFDVVIYILCVHLFLFSLQVKNSRMERLINHCLRDLS